MTIRTEWLKGLTDKQAAFVAAYCSDAFSFNATAAAKEAGYNAGSPHAFEQIGWQNWKMESVTIRSLESSAMRSRNFWQRKPR
jgi:hypothetical protein